jgi:hypothetical protein
MVVFCYNKELNGITPNAGDVPYIGLDFGIYIYSSTYFNCKLLLSDYVMKLLVKITLFKGA